MTPIALYPSRANRKKAAALGAMNLFAGFLFLTWMPFGVIWVPVMFGAAGLSLIGQAAWSHFNPRPSFEADEHGFRVLGKKKLAWEAYRGADIQTVRVGFVPIMRNVVIKTGKTILGRRVHIKAMHLSASAQEMVREIEAYAKHAKRAQDLQAALSTLPLQTAATAVVSGPTMHPRPVAPGKTPGQHDPENGPIQSTPRLSERLFGRRKVI